MATLPGAWRYRVSARTGRPGVSILRLGEMDSWICNFYLGVAARQLSVQISPLDTLACCWDVKQPTTTNNFSSHHITEATVLKLFKDLCTSVQESEAPSLCGLDLSTTYNVDRVQLASTIPAMFSVYETLSYSL